MSTPKREYARIYHDVVDDSDMKPIYANDLAWSTWTKLLLIGDQAWPSSGMLPAGLSRQGLKLCVDHGAVIVDGNRFRIRGMDKERTSRSERARRAANALHGGSERSEDADDDGMQSHPPSTANGEQTHPSGTAEKVPSKAKPSRAEQSRAEQEQTRAPNGDLSDRERIGDAMREASGLHFPMPSRNGDRLELMAKRDGIDRLLETITQAAEDMGGYPDQSALVNTVANYLNTPLSGKRETLAQREERERAERVARLNAEAAARRAPQRVA